MKPIDVPERLGRWSSGRGPLYVLLAAALRRPLAPTGRRSPASCRPATTRPARCCPTMTGAAAARHGVALLPGAGLDVTGGGEEHLRVPFTPPLAG